MIQVRAWSTRTRRRADASAPKRCTLIGYRALRGTAVPGSADTNEQPMDDADRSEPRKIVGHSGSTAFRSPSFISREVFRPAKQATLLLGAQPR
jgi:hypothetical protein